ncbi:uncharacterized protein KY384_004787 [Bacidia gigantensis]|uniref:uncharacterized protein n=1 Tax=Bacidia gigantensis TaxID=2732470 RepID=UPI001D04B821|nr:uncharacterized protein KY384_004787 [Bacidia gigantensis]KAG8530285.1 hypothetical protein KY384_004787 [Bacidia gigantensis]
MAALSAIIWTRGDGKLVNCVYSVDSTRRMVEFGADCHATASRCSWSQTYRFTETSAGDVSAVAIADGGIRLYLLDDKGYIGELAYDGVEASIESSLQATLDKDKNGTPKRIFVTFVDPYRLLKEII